MNEMLETRRAAKGRTAPPKLTLQTPTHWSVFSLCGRLLMLGACASGMGLSGCGGGDSQAPNFARRNTYAGLYSISVNQTSSGTVANATLPSGAGTLTAAQDNTLTTNFTVTDTTRSVTPGRAVTTTVNVVSTFADDGSFDVSGRVREFNSRDGSITTGQPVRLQGRLPLSGSSTTVTVDIGTKTTTGTIRFLSPISATPSPTTL